MDAIGGMGFDYVASGHYANVIHPSADGMNEPSVLELSQDMVLKNLLSVCLLLYLGDISVLSALSEESSLIILILSFAYFITFPLLCRKIL